MDELRPPPGPLGLPGLLDEDVREVPVGTRLLRIHFRGGKHPAEWHEFRAYGPRAEARFDHHDVTRSPDENEVRGDRAVWHGAVQAMPRSPQQADGHADPLTTAVAEVFSEDRLVDRGTNEPWLTVVEVVRHLRLLDAGSGWGARAGCGGLLGTGRKRLTRDWSRAVYAAYPDVDGIVWASSEWPPGDGVFLYERARDAFPPNPLATRPLDDAALDRGLRRAAKWLGSWPLV